MWFRKAIETISRVHVGRDEETEELDTLRGDMVVQREDVSVCSDLESARFQKISTNLWRVKKLVIHN